uniref:Hyaluronidase n=1 Tax=Eumenes pomiformis TaxID=693051 RepID=D1MEJ6_EUMPO|nr:venom hyaluronidase [Eumenes pomiformis]
MILAVQLVLLLLYPIVRAGITDICGFYCTPEYRVKRHFYIYWNVPTFMCHKYGLDFSEVKDFNIMQNKDDLFHGDVVTIMYDPGSFPAMLPLNKTTKKDKYKKRNGGVPQMGNYQKHRTAFIEDLDKYVPDVDYDGIGVIDFEHWKPIFRQNWGTQKLYKDLSYDLVKQMHPLWSRPTIESEAIKKFEKNGRYFMEETLKTAKKYRFKGDWGYYGYPYCYNLSPGHPGIDCNQKAMSDNDKMSWLFNNQDLLMPSVYVKYFMQAFERAALVQGRVKEAVRISNNHKNLPRVIPYWWYKYTDQMDVFLSEKDVKNTFREILYNGGDGIIIWGSSADVNSESKCKRLRKYLIEMLGPLAAKLIHSANEGTFLDY